MISLQSDFRVEPADYAVDFADLRAVREPVFVIEQQVPIEEEWDALDPSCRHVLARDADGRPIGTARLTPERKIGRMAVVADWRGRGVGAALLAALVDQARALGWPQVSLNAQVTALGFYEKLGFEAYGDAFVEAGIRHRAMRRTLPPLDRSRGATVAPLPASDPAQAIQTLGEAIAIAERIVAGARRRLCIHTRDLDPGLYGDVRVLRALTRFAVDGRDASVRVLTHDTFAAQGASHPLLALAQRLPSTFALRVVEEPVDAQLSSAFLASDQGGFYHRPIGSRYDGEASACLPARARQLIGAFEPLWERGRPATEFRALGL